MKIRKNATGGFFTILLGLAILYLFLTTLFFQFYDNVKETKTSIPTVVATQNWGDIAGDLEFKLILR